MLGDKNYEAKPWMREAECLKRGIPTDAFFPEQSAPPEVRAACYACDVRPECSEWAIRLGEMGYWGGMSEKARKSESRRRGRENLKRSQL